MHKNKPGRETRIFLDAQNNSVNLSDNYQLICVCSGVFMLRALFRLPVFSCHVTHYNATVKRHSSPFSISYLDCYSRHILVLAERLICLSKIKPFMYMADWWKKFTTTKLNVLYSCIFWIYCSLGTVRTVWCHTTWITAVNLSTPHANPTITANNPSMIKMSCSQQQRLKVSLLFKRDCEKYLKKIASFQGFNLKF